MSLDAQQLIQLCELAKSSALAAGEIISKASIENITVEKKDGGENIASQVVTEIDIKSQEKILEILGPSLKEYNLGLLTEESVDEGSRFKHDYFWCIDPLDGTLCFSKGEDGYSNSIALVAKDGTPIIGVVYNPKEKKLYSAIKSQGAYISDEKLEAKRVNNYLTLLYDMSFTKHPMFEELVKELDQKAKEQGLEGIKLHHLGGAVMNGISTVTMSPALYFKFPKKADGGGSIWDFAASSVIQSEAGSFNSDYHGSPIDLNRANSTFMNHKGIIYVSDKDLLNFIPSLDSVQESK